ncbi:isochorismatase family protein [Paraburkholderia kururiensis]|uniref:isochorismatase family protein n=1 Tax=Paraburkholderia kururiensis TaxID=984307 RepID=UPI0018F3FE53|nr:isochorismatase family protein [Paraburkholderia kururiensis]
MSATTLDPRTALIIVDLQKGIAALPAAAPIEVVTQKAGLLAAAFRERALPVVLVNVAGGAAGRTEQSRGALPLAPDWTELLPALGQQPQDHLVTKHTWGAFTGTSLESWLKSEGVTQVVLAGVATSIGVESTAREAYALGFNVTLAIDAMTDMSADAHANSVSRIFPRLGETGTTQEIIALLGTQHA